MPGIKFTDYIPVSLVVNSPSPTLAADVVTGLPIPTGAFPGNVFYLNEQQANQASVPGGTLFHAGWYMVVQVNSGANSAKVAVGFVGHQYSLTSPSQAIDPSGIVTDAGNGVVIGNNPVVFLNAITPGNYGIVMVAGDGWLNGAAAETLGTVLAYSTAGTVAALSATFANNSTATIAGIVTAASAGAGLVRANIAFSFSAV